MMTFRTIADAITTLLGDAAANRFQVLGYQKQTIDVDDILGNKRLVEVYYYRGDFPKLGSSISSSKKLHDITFKIDFKCAASAKGDLSKLNSDDATQQEIAAALFAVSVAAKEANDLMDEFFEIIYQIIMSASNIDLGLSIGMVSNRWINEFQKDEPLQKGALVVLTATCMLTCRTNEDITGDIITTANSIDTTIDLYGDTENITGVETDPSN